MTRTPAFKPNARTIFDARYPRKDADGNPAETPAETVERVAINVAMPNALYVPATDALPETTPNPTGFPFATARRQYEWLRKKEGLKPGEGIDLPTQLAIGWDVAQTQAERYMEDLLVPLHFLPNSPTWTGAGTPLGQLAACFVLPVADDLGQTPDSIMQVLYKATMIQQTGGGNGFSFGRLRPKNALVKRSMGKASGPMGFARVYNGAFKEIAQGGSRRGANMLVMPVWHPDIREFIAAKVEEGVLDQFNFSVAITDEFMQAVEKDGDFDLRFDGKVYETIKARDLWDEITRNAWVIGDPGNLFIDRANRDNPCPARYTLEATNPCVTGETLVATPQGWRRADSIKEGDEVCTVLGSGEVKEIEVNPAVPVYKVTFSDGGVIRATAAHKFHVRPSQTKFFTPTRLDQAQVGQWVRVAKGSLPNNTVRQPDSRMDERGRLRDSHLPDRQYGLLMGILAGDGSCSPKTIANGQIAICTSTDDAEWNDVVTTLLEQWGCSTVGRHQDAESKALRLYPQPSRAFATWLAMTPYIPSLAPDRVLPEEFINSNEDFLLGLLDGLFSTDGSVNLRSNHPQIRFHTASRDLAEQVRLMLLCFGVHARISKSNRKPHTMADGREIRYDRPKYDLTISGESFGRFADQITLSHPQKQAKLDEARLRCNFTGGNWAAKIVSIEPDGIETVYDLYEPKSDTWLTAGYVSQGCGEQWLPPYSNCCLGSISVAHFASWGDGASYGSFDWEKFRQTIILSAQFLDDVVDANRYVPEVPELEQAAMGERRIGLGLMGLADAMLKMGVRYGSPEGRSFASQVTEFARFWTMMTSIERAKERGPFEWIADSIYNPALIAAYGCGAAALTGLDGEVHNLWERPRPLDGSFHDAYEFGMPEFHWDEVEQGIRNWGIRNACQFTFAPTGTISNVAGLEGSGCEPVFAIVYSRTMMQDEENVTLFYASDLFREALLRYHPYTDDQMQEIIDAVVANNGSCQGVDLIPESIQRVFVTAADVTGEEHVWMQASLQAWVDNSISKTINLPNEATVEDVANIYRLAYDLGCKGITVYRQGSRSLEVLATTKDTKGNLTDWPVVEPLAIPTYAHDEGLDAKVFPVETYFGKVQVTITHIKGYDDRPFDVRMQVGKGGNDKNADVEAIGRLASLALRGGLSVEAIVAQLEHIGGATSFGFGDRKVRSVADGLAKLLKRLYMAEEVEAGVVTNPTGSSTLTLAQGDVCPLCLQATVVIEAGCRHCETRLGGCGEFSGCD